MDAIEAVTEAVMTTVADAIVGRATHTSVQRATHKIVFEYADSDDEEGTAHTLAVTGAETLTLDRKDMEDPVEAAKLRGFSDDDVADMAGADNGDDELDFVEDVTPQAVMTPQEVYAGVLAARHVALPDDLLPIPRAPDARVRTLRVGRALNAAVHHRADEPPADADEPVDEVPREVVKRARDVKVTKDGYHLTVDERDLVEALETCITRRPPRPEFAELLRDDDGVSRHPEPAMPAGAPSGSIAADEVDADVPQEVADESVRADADSNDNDDDDEEDEEEDEEDAMMDDLLLVAAVEQMMRCCEASIPERLREAEECAHEHRRAGIAGEIEAMRALVENGRAAHEKLCADEMSPLEFARLMKPHMGRVYGAMKRALRPPKPEPIIINGVVMDM